MTNSRISSDQRQALQKAKEALLKVSPENRRGVILMQALKRGKFDQKNMSPELKKAFKAAIKEAKKPAAK